MSKQFKEQIQNQNLPNNNKDKPLEHQTIKPQKRKPNQNKVQKITIKCQRKKIKISSQLNQRNGNIIKIKKKKENIIL